MNPRVVFCCWCKAVTIHPGDKPDAHLAVTVTGDGTRTATLDAQPITIQDGICAECRAKEFPKAS